MTHRDMWLDTNAVEGRMTEVMHPHSYLARTGISDGCIGISPVFPLSDRYMAGYVVGRAWWDALVAEAYGE